MKINPEIVYISKLSKDKRYKILNRPSKGFFKQTVLDVVVRNLKINQEDGNTGSIARYKDLKKTLTEAGQRESVSLLKPKKPSLNNPLKMLKWTLCTCLILMCSASAFAQKQDSTLQLNHEDNYQRTFVVKPGSWIYYPPPNMA